MKFNHELFVAADCSQNIIRILFVDFSKAFDDVIDHNILLDKFISNDDFLNGRKQLVKIGDSVSNTTIVGDGTQGTVSGPNDIRLVTNDLKFNTCFVKYVDDTTVLSVSNTVNDNTLQASADHLVHWTQNNGMMINTSKIDNLII